MQDIGSLCQIEGDINEYNPKNLGLSERENNNNKTLRYPNAACYFA